MQLPLQDDNEMRLPNFRLGDDLLSYLSSIRKVVFSQTEHKDVTLVLGNSSCDLDSFICAFTLSYFYNAKPDATKHHRHPIFVPVLNLPFIQTGDLWRLRPEFGVAVRGAVDGLSSQTNARPSDDIVKAQQDRDKTLLEHLITIHELSTSDNTISSLKHAFAPSGHFPATSSTSKVDVILVDHNSPAIETLNEEDTKARFNVVGCIDHHVEEHYVPEKAHPWIVQLGIGSCQSLVTQHLRKLNMWTIDQSRDKLPGFRQISRLALAPILVDTWDLKAPGNRVSQIDRDQADFLDDFTGDDFDREDLFSQAQAAKESSLNLLDMQEIFSRDYKSYLETTKDHKQVYIGIASVVQSLEWLVEHARGKEKLINEIEKYSRGGEKQLEIFGLLTRAGERKEVAFFAFGQRGMQAIEDFEQTAEELKLQSWAEDDELANLLNERIGKSKWHVWWMGDVSKSRKQVGPLIRNSLQKSSA